MKIIVAVLCLGLIHASVASSTLDTVVSTINYVYNGYRTGEFLNNVRNYVKSLITTLELLKTGLSLPLISSVPSLSSLPTVPSLSSLPTVPSLSSLPTVPSLPSAQSIPIIGTITNAFSSLTSAPSTPAPQAPAPQQSSQSNDQGRWPWQYQG